MRVPNNPQTADQSKSPDIETELTRLFSQYEPDQEMIEAQKFIDEALRHVKLRPLPDVEVEVSAIGTKDDADKK